MNERTLIAGCLLLCLCLCAACAEREDYFSSTTVDEDPTTGARSHWMEPCETSDQCSDQDAECFCGMCTRPCQSGADCDDIEQGGQSAACVGGQQEAFLHQCGAPRQDTGVCLFSCEQDAQCQGGQSCVDGACVEVCQETAFWRGEEDLSELPLALDVDARVSLLNSGAGHTLYLVLCADAEPPASIASYGLRLFSTDRPTETLFEGRNTALTRACAPSMEVLGVEQDVLHGDVYEATLRVLSQPAAADDWDNQCQPLVEAPRGMCWLEALPALGRTCRNSYSVP
jgi:hypothetical protein